jgi:hypothetical protein
METHRLVIQFSPPELQGGELLLHGSRQDDDVQARFPSAFNSSVAFALSSDSYHSVTPVEGGVRYTIIYSFWSEDSLRPARRDGAFVGTPYYDALAAVLQAMGAKRIPHSGRDLYDHLAGTAALLDSWGCSRPLSAAGLFHSVYGTESFHDALVRTSDRAQLQALIGEDTERLVYLYDLGSKSSLYQSLREPSPEPVMFDRLEQRNVAVTMQELVDLVVLDVANFAEQALHGEGEVEIDPELAGHFAFLAPVMPKGAQHTLGELGVL